MAASEPASVSTILQDVEYFEATFGSTRAARAKVEAQSHEIAALYRRVNTLRAQLSRAKKEGEALRARYAPAALFEHLKREFVCLGGLQLLELSIARWHAGQAPQVAVPPRTVFLAVHETSVPTAQQPAPATPPPTRASSGTPIRTPVTEALHASRLAVNAGVRASRPVPAMVSRREEPAVQSLMASSSKASPVASLQHQIKDGSSTRAGAKKACASSSSGSKRARTESKVGAQNEPDEKKQRRRRRKRAQAASIVVCLSDDDDLALVAPVESPSRPEKRARVSVSPTLEAPQPSPPRQPAASLPSPPRPPPSDHRTTLEEQAPVQDTTKSPARGRDNRASVVDCPVPSPDIIRPAYKRSTHILLSPSPSSPTPSPSPQHLGRKQADTPAVKSLEQRLESSTSSTKAQSSSTASPSSSSSASPTAPLGSQPSQAPRRTRAAAKQAEAVAAGIGVKRTASDVLVKQIIEWPSDRRNLVNMKQSATFLTLKGIEALEATEPWNDMFVRRARFCSLINPDAVDARALKWLKATLRTQFVLRREFWERLHWLPISETVCVGVEWSKYRKARSRRASYAARVWRKLYEESIELMAAGVLRDDVWCDPALWYMPAAHVSWLPKSGDLLAELAAEDHENPSRTYFAAAPSWHPFYQDERFTELVETRYALPLFSPHQQIALQEESKDGSEEHHER